MAAVFRLRAAGRAMAPVRTGMPIGEGGVLLLMPAAAHEQAGTAMAGAKLVSVHPNNRERGHPTLYASYVLMDGATGQPLAYLEGTYLTAVRTGATSALATSLLARSDARRVTCFGAGVQAGFQLAALAAARRLERIAVVGRDPGRARSFATTMAKRLG